MAVCSDLRWLALPGLSGYAHGSTGGQEEVALTVYSLPVHNHAINASSDATDKNATGSVPGSTKQRICDSHLNADTTWDASAVGMTVDGTPHEDSACTLRIMPVPRTTSIYTLETTRCVHTGSRLIRHTPADMLELWHTITVAVRRVN
jgi:microcystin-dependent protein